LTHETNTAKFVTQKDFLIWAKYKVAFTAKLCEMGPTRLALRSQFQSSSKNKCAPVNF